MNTEWQVHRTFAEHSDGQRRWDYAYQFLLRWTMEQTVGHQPQEENSQENKNEDSSLCSSIDQPSNAKSKY